jgi:hypothetical protein
MREDLPTFAPPWTAAPAFLLGGIFIEFLDNQGVVGGGRINADEGKENVKDIWDVNKRC